MTRACNFCMTPLVPVKATVQCPTCGARYVPVKGLGSTP